MYPFPVFPSIPIRLSRPQYELVAPAFKRIAALHAYCMANGVKPIFYLYEVSPRPTTLKGRYDQAIMPAFLNLGSQLASLFSTPGGSRRLRLTALQIEFLMYAARVTRKQVAHGHIAQPVNYSTSKTTRLLKKLEAVRKRAKWCWRASPDASAVYPHMQARWAKLAQWIHIGLLYCTCHRLPPTGIRRKQRRYVDHTVALAHEVLTKESIPKPAAGELRHLVRAFLRSVRFGYQRTTLGSVLHGGSWSKQCLAEFLIPRIQKKLLKTIQASKGDSNVA